MAMNTIQLIGIESYVNGFPAEVQVLLRQLHSTIKEIVPEAVESFKYGMPTFELNGNLVHYAGYKHHIGFYPGPDAIVAFAAALKSYKTSKGAIQFPLDISLPTTLIQQIVHFRKVQNFEKQALKKR